MSWSSPPQYTHLHNSYMRFSLFHFCHLPFLLMYGVAALFHCLSLPSFSLGPTSRQRTICVSLVNFVLCLRFPYTFDRDTVSACAFALIWFDCVTVSKFFPQYLLCIRSKDHRSRHILTNTVRMCVCVGSIDVIVHIHTLIFDCMRVDE